ncbi:hypothetical protein [Pseudomonas sp. S37]|nr:hypothetical protein [Pseudomonas sp. S37]
MAFSQPQRGWDKAGLLIGVQVGAGGVLLEQQAVAGKSNISNSNI